MRFSRSSQSYYLGFNYFSTAVFFSSLIIQEVFFPPISSSFFFFNRLFPFASTDAAIRTSYSGGTIGLRMLLSRCILGICHLQRRRSRPPSSPLRFSREITTIKVMAATQAFEAQKNPTPNGFFLILFNLTLLLREIIKQKCQILNRQRYVCLIKKKRQNNNPLLFNAFT